MQLEADTIVAIATPPGRGGLGIVRLSGPRALAFAASIAGVAEESFAPGRVRLVRLREEDGSLLDEAVVTFFAEPRSYTGEDVVELAVHGAPVLLDWLLRAAVACGARLAEPGEFTRRAVLSGRLDLTQAEAVHDLVAAQTLEQARVAAAQLGGALARAVAPHKEALLTLIAELEAGIDFAEDDLDVLPPQALAGRLRALHDPLQALARTYATGRLVRDGFTLALVGRPNAGKSSLFNRLLDRDRAIVTAAPGTTRDPIAERLSFGGIPVELIDTAGLRRVSSGEEHEPERQGIARSRTALAEADLVLHVLDATAPAHTAEAGDQVADQDVDQDAWVASQLAGRPHVTLWNKCDLVPSVRPAAGTVAVSALTGEGMEAVRQAIQQALSLGSLAVQSGLVTTLRQHNALTAAVSAMARSAADSHLPHELMLLDLYAALEALDELTGATPSGAVLDRIFSTFCIGK